MPRPLAVIGITIFFTLSVLCSAGNAFSFPIFCAATVGFLFGMINKSARKQAVLPCAAVAAAAACILFSVSYKCDYLPTISAASNYAEVEAVVVDLPYQKDGKYKYTLEDSDGRRILLSSKTKLRAQPYDTLKFVGTVYVLGGDDTEIRNYFRSNSIYLGAYTADEITVTKCENPPPMLYVLKLREHILNSVTTYLPKDEGGVVAAMLLGDTGYISHAATVAFRDTGVLHMFAVSGLHVTVWSMLVLAFFDKLRLGRISSSLLTALFVLLFIALTGFSKSCMRAGIMMLVILAGRIISREADAINSLGLSLIIICAAKPLAADNIGLWLSSLSTFGILLLSPVSADFVKRRISHFRPSARKIITALTSSFTVSSAAAIFTLPVAVISFECVSVISPITNLLTVPVAEISMLFGGLIPVFANAGFMSFLSHTAAFISGILAKYLLFITSALSKVSFAYVSMGEKYVKLWLSLTLLLFAAAIIISRQNRRVMRITSLLCVMTLVAGTLSFNLINRNLACISVLNVGNGSAVLVTGDGNKGVLIGCGGDYFAADAICEKMRVCGVRELELLLLPRPQATEMNAASDLLREVNVQTIAAPEFSESLARLDLENDIAYSRSILATPWQDFKLEYLFNDDSCAAYLTVNSVSVLIVFSPGTDISLFPKKWLEADVLCCRQSPPNIMNCEKYGITIISGAGEKAARAAEKISSLGGRAYTTAYNTNVTVKINGNAKCRVEME